MINSNSENMLPNGLRVLFVEQKELKDSGLGVAVQAGPYWENENNLGISHLLEHLISRLDVGEGDMRDAIYQKGGVFDASTSVLQTCFFLYSLNEDFLESSKIFIKGIFGPKFREGALAKSKESIISEIANSQKLTSYEILRSLMWKDEKLRRSLIGEKETLLTISLANILNYHSQRYLTPGVSVVVIGPSFPKGLEKILSKVELQEKKSESIVFTKINTPDFRMFEGGNLHSTLTFGFPTKGYKNLGEDRHVFRLAASVLNSVYISEMAKSGFIYQSNWSWNIFPDTGEFVLEFVDLAPEHVLTVTKAATRLINDWSNLYISEKDFDLIKKQRILAIRMVEGLSESLPLITKDFSSSEEAHTPDEAIKIYEKATLDNALGIAKDVLLTKMPFLIVNMGDDSLKYTSSLKTFLDEYYK